MAEDASLNSEVTLQVKVISYESRDLKRSANDDDCNVMKFLSTFLQELVKKR